MVASPKTAIITAFDPVSSSVTPLAIVRLWNARTSRVGPPVCAIVLAEGSVCEQVAPLHAVPSNVTTPAQLRSTGPTGEMVASCAAVTLLGVYPKVDELHDAGMPGLPSWQPNPSAT